MNVSVELVRVARLLCGEKTVEVDGGKDVRHQLQSIQRAGDVATFMYQKKDGTSRKVHVKPTSVFGDKFKAVDLDAAGAEKLFLMSGVQPLASSHAPAVPVVHEPKKFKFQDKVLMDNDISRSLHGLVKKGGAWASERQRDFILGKIARDGDSARRLLPRGVFGLIGRGGVLSGWESTGDGFSSCWLFRVDDVGVVDKILIWQKTTPMDREQAAYEQAMEDLYDDMGGRPDRYMVEELKSHYSQHARSWSGQQKGGTKVKWSRM